ncbi:MAG: radical SAM protein [Elusimicrobiaceae bacterium]|nr:radical SAM protein [Elusimicrobiaceae bacterium]
MTDKYRIDSHKLIYHPARVAQWLAGENIYPIYAELSPSGGCNHRCTYCALDFMEYRPRFLDTEILRARMSELGALGLKSAMFAGEGEPFLHPAMPEIANFTKAAGIDVSFTTNGALFTPQKADECLQSISWLKVSINGGTAQTHARIHRAPAGDFDKIMDNMACAARLRATKKYRCALGMQMVLLPENAHEAETLARAAREIGMDYLVIKPYSQHPQSKTDGYKDIKYTDLVKQAEAAEKLSGAGFSVILRRNTMRVWDCGEKGYDKCLALPFWTYIDSGGAVWGCSMFLQDERFLYGNINGQTFRELWESERRGKSLQFVREELDASRCRLNCRMEHINRYLWELKHPGEHVNFI